MSTIGTTAQSTFTIHALGYQLSAEVPQWSQHMSAIQHRRDLESLVNELLPRARIEFSVGLGQHRLTIWHCSEYQMQAEEATFRETYEQHGEWSPISARRF
jgi:hypothetical protein